MHGFTSIKYYVLGALRNYNPCQDNAKSITVAPSPTTYRTFRNTDTNIELEENLLP